MTYFINQNFDSEERYDMSKFMEWIDGTYDVLSSYFIEELRKLPLAGVYRVELEPFRPDLVSYDVYGDPQYWWLLLEYNGWVDWTQFSLGSSVNLFALTDLENLFFSLSSKQHIRDNDL